MTSRLEVLDAIIMGSSKTYLSSEGGLRPAGCGIEDYRAEPMREGRIWAS